MTDFIIELIVKKIVEKPLLVRMLRVALDLDRIESVYINTMITDVVKEDEN